MDSPKEKKKRRTLAVVDGDALKEGQSYHFSFLESEKRLEIWFFFREKIQHSFHLKKDFSARNVVMPRYEDDLHLYILKRVCYELGRRSGKYRRVYLIGEHHPMWEGLVQFLRERGIPATHMLADDYSETIEAAREDTLSAREAVSSISVREKSPTQPPPKKRKGSSKEKGSPLPSIPDARTERARAVYRKVLEGLRGFAPGTKLGRQEFLSWLHSQNISVKRDIPSQNLAFFLRRLSESGTLQLEEDGTILITHTA
ncbi:MAG: hypothetical protein NZ580_05330 [Bacteroidia bacterium]|nr:hypothetical protein [Bacteroidia bacterium]MDW8235916.1 hypothetical protein [Bacteroidia bacterium]